NSASEQETAVPPRSANETRTPHTPPISDEFVSAQKVVAAEVAQRPETCRASSAPAIPSRRGEKCSRRTMAEELRACGREARAAPATAGSEGNARAKFAIHIPRAKLLA